MTGVYVQLKVGCFDSLQIIKLAPHLSQLSGSMLPVGRETRRGRQLAIFEYSIHHGLINSEKFIPQS